MNLQPHTRSPTQLGIIADSEYLEKPRQERSAFPHFHRPDDEDKNTGENFRKYSCRLDAHNCQNSPRLRAI